MQDFQESTIDLIFPAVLPKDLGMTLIPEVVQHTTIPGMTIKTTII